jgi:hypothetical protein
MLGNISTMDEGNSDNKINQNEKILSKIFKNQIDNPTIIKTDENYTNDKEALHDSSSYYLKKTQIENKFFIPLKNSTRRISKTTYGPKKICKKIKKVTIDNPFITIVPIESYKEYNLKMTYNDYESVPDVNQVKKTCPCNKQICSIF